MQTNKQLYELLQEINLKLDKLIESLAEEEAPQNDDLAGHLMTIDKPENNEL